MHNREERFYKSLWHLAIALVGVYELRNHKTRISKILACGLIAFHVDASICDAMDVPTTPQRWLARLKKPTWKDYNCYYTQNVLCGNVISAPDRAGNALRCNRGKGHPGICSFTLLQYLT